MVSEPLRAFRPSAQLQPPRLGLQRQRLPVVAAAQRAAPRGLAGGPVVRGGVPERGADLRASLVPLHQHQRGLQRVRSKPPLKHFFNVDICWASCLMVQQRFDSTWSFSFMCVGTQSDVLLCLQAGLPMRRPGLRDEPPPPGLLGGARRMRPAARPAAVQLCRLQRQIQAPLPLQGLSQRPGGAMRGLPMTTQRGSGRKPSPPPPASLGVSEDSC